MSSIEVGRCRPLTWGKYTFISSTVKIIQRQEPVSLFARMMTNSYTTRRRSNRFRFHDTSVHKIGRMMLKNRLTMLNEFDCEWLTFSEDINWELNLKSASKWQHRPVVVFLLGRGTQTLQRPSFSHLKNKTGLAHQRPLGHFEIFIDIYLLTNVKTFLLKLINWQKRHFYNVTVTRLLPSNCDCTVIRKESNKIIWIWITWGSIWVEKMCDQKR